MTFNADEERDLPHIISIPRFATYLHAAGNDTQKALSLYQWNLEVSAAFIVPLQICEVAIRNGVVVALESQYGANWHQSQSLLLSLPSSGNGYTPHGDFSSTKNKLLRKGSFTPGKMVAELKFVFWEMMLTRKHDQRLWVPYFTDAFPHADPALNVYQARLKAHDELEAIRNLRNRIAHHEPIFSRDLKEEYNRIVKLIHWRSPTSAIWVDKVQTVTEIVSNKPCL